MDLMRFLLLVFVALLSPMAFIPAAFGMDLSDESETTNAANRNAVTSKTLEEAIMKGLQTVERQFKDQLQKHACPNEVYEGAEQFIQMISSKIAKTKEVKEFLPTISLNTIEKLIKSNTEMKRKVNSFYEKFKTNEEIGKVVEMLEKGGQFDYSKTIIVQIQEIVAKNRQNEPKKPSESRILQIVLELWTTIWKEENAILKLKKEEKENGEIAEKAQNKLERGKTLKKNFGEAKEMESRKGNFLPMSASRRTSSIFDARGKGIDFVWPPAPIKNVGMENAKNTAHIDGSDLQRDEGNNKIVDGKFQWDIPSSIGTSQGKRERKKWEIPINPIKLDKLELTRSNSASSIEAILGNKEDEKLKKDNKDNIHVPVHPPRSVFRAQSVASALPTARGKPPKRAMGEKGGGLRGANFPPSGILSSSGSSRQLHQQQPGKSKLSNQIRSSAAAPGIALDQQVAEPSDSESYAEIWTRINKEKVALLSTRINKEALGKVD